jgi:hypothetical protein
VIEKRIKNVVENIDGKQEVRNLGVVARTILK